MASSLSPECTPLKHEYDNCFNSWFEGYLEPVVGSTDKEAPNREQEKHVRAKAEEYESNCGKLWGAYKECVQVRLAGVYCKQRSHATSFAESRSRQRARPAPQ